MQQQLQSAANGRTGDPGSGKWRLRSNTLGSINGGVHLQIYPCFLKGTWSEPNFQTSILMMFHVTSSGVKSKLNLNFPTWRCFCWSVVSATGGLCFNLHSFHHTVFSNLMIFWWVHLPSPAMHPSGPPQNSMTSSDAYEASQGGNSCECFPRVFSCCKLHGMLFFGVLYIHVLRQGIFMCLLKNTQHGCRQTTLW